MDKFLELSFTNHMRNNEEIVVPYEECFKPIVEFVEERLSQKACEDFTELLYDCYTEGLRYAGVIGMELAIGVMNGTIKQVI